MMDDFAVTRLRSKRLKYRTHYDEDKALCYAKFWQEPPPTLINRIVEYLKEQYDGPLAHALDVGCGNGYSSKIWSNHFQNVTGIDVNPAKVSDARRHDPPSNIRFAVAPAESVSLPDGSVTIIVSKASHWFDMGDFFSEAERLLMPKGIVALYNACITPMDFPDLPPETNQKLKNVVEWADRALSKHWPAARSTVVEEYANVSMPFQDYVLIRDGSIYQDVTLSPKDMIQYILSWVSFYRLKNVEGHEAATKFMKDITQRISEVVPDMDQTFTGRFKYFLLLGRKPATA